MRSPGAIHQKLKQLKYRAYQQIASQNLKKKPKNCIHNVKVITNSGLEVRLCKKFPNTLCDEQHHDGFQRALECSEFKAILTKKEVKESTDLFFKESKLSEIAQDYPDIAALLWVLQDVDLKEIQEEDDKLVLMDLILDSSREEGASEKAPQSPLEASNLTEDPELTSEAQESQSTVQEPREQPLEGEGWFTPEALTIPQASYFKDLNKNYLQKIPFFASIVASLHLLYLKFVFFR